MDTRLPAGTIIDSDDWHVVLSAVFDPLDARSSRGVWGFAETEYAAMTRGQQAIFDLRWLRDLMEADTFLEYCHEPTLQTNAGRLVADAQLVGAHPFLPLLKEITAILVTSPAWPLDDALCDDVERLEAAVFALEDEHLPLWHWLADYVRRTPAEFIHPDPRQA